MKTEAISATEYAEREGLSRQHVTWLCRRGRIPGAERVGRAWIIRVQVKP